MTSAEIIAPKKYLERLLLALSGGVLLFLIACSIAPQWMATASPTDMRMDRVLLPPGGDHWFGTDNLGRDVYSVVVHGSRYSLLIGVASVALGCFAGTLLGLLAGYFGGIWDAIIMRVVDTLMTIPGILLALAIAASLGPGMRNIVLAVAISSVPGYARIMRGGLLSLQNRPFALAARSLGASRPRVFLLHLLPHSLPPVLLMAALGIGSAILAGSGLSFLGLGEWKEVPDWGAILSQGRSYLTVAWWISTFPGIAITLFVLSINLIGDRLRDVFDPAGPLE
jgi:peptide/nickel transport system permease protein